MAYSDFNLTKLQRLYGIGYDRTDLFPRPHRQETPSALLLAELEDSKLFPLLTEKAKSEFLIAPILRELARRNANGFTLFSGFSLDVDEVLNGFCDYLLSRKPRSIEVSAPVFCLVEAKNRTVEEGFGQCAAEMLAAYRFNQLASEPLDVIYGAVTTGNDWAFLQLNNQTILIDNERFVIEQLPELLGALQHIIDTYSIA
ncbi:MAG: hypothetical protein LH609_00120 [Rudanella sp.]|nr:hypothetical protein [Rudanella sp.]